MIAYVTEINSEDFEVKTSGNSLVVLDIWAEWCGPCKMLSPIVDQLSVDYLGKVLVAKMDADKNMEFIGKKLNVRNIPTILFLKDGDELERTVGLKSKSELSSIIEKYI
jgi:thioredoxin 1